METAIKSPRSWQHITLMIVCAALTVILVVLIMAMVYVKSRLGFVNRVSGTAETLSREEIENILSETDGNDGDNSWETVDPGDINWGTGSDNIPIAQGEDVTNILIIGQDQGKGEERQRSDVMILWTIDNETQTMTLTSFLRDLYVRIPGYGENRIGVSYQLGGMELLDACLEKNFGIEVDYNVEVDLDRFIKIIDLVDGVDIELTTVEATYLNDLASSVDSEGGAWNLRRGLNHLTAIQALAYTRIMGNGEFDRTGRQRKVLDTLFDKLNDLSPTQLDKLIVHVLQSLTTDMEDSQILEISGDLIPSAAALTVYSQSVPKDGMYKPANVNGLNVLIPDFEMIREQLRQTLGGWESVAVLSGL